MTRNRYAQTQCANATRKLNAQIQRAIETQNANAMHKRNAPTQRASATCQRNAPTVRMTTKRAHNPEKTPSCKNVIAPQPTHWLVKKHEPANAT